MHSTIAICLLLASAVLSMQTASARPADWYHWKSKGDGHLICVQAYPGSGWEQADGPYPDHNCTRPSPVPTAVNIKR
ncbi:hypothetical protein SAMN02745857_02094 [Andreprevotia lacus DSM 23236]|jgi:hypothetical protein|uniref:DUF4124 domain-containing protein n=1 Tax=Andreprevotia lacus DSM 23236 TaxID=1121001 RepID=A0A1W1XP20_9NEIS|nr:hypothetical protein [Andreprevotia lacus]SMC25261.1 hypothetical protein SAMN02745857_02094 [Andreprevotia lacus DSM 23236]